MLFSDSLLTPDRSRPYRVAMTSAQRSFYVYSYYYGYPRTGRGWRRTRD
jgi:hypothetical protein